MTFVSALVVPVVLAAQSAWSFEAPGVDLERGDLFGWSIVEFGDLDGDGARDVAVGCPLTYDDNGRTRVWVFSGRTGAVVAELGTSGADAGIGGWLANAGDVDGDGRDDLLFNSGDRRVALWSLSQGRLLELPAPRWHYETPSMLGAPGDVDGDGRRDLVVGASVRSGCDGRELRSFSELDGFELGVDSSSIVPDLDGDGVDEIALVALDTRRTHIVVVSAVTGAELVRAHPLSVPVWTYVPQPDGTYRACEKSEERVRVRVQSGFTCDVDADGVREVVVYATGAETWAGFLATMPLVAGAPLSQWNGGSGDGELLWAGSALAGPNPDVLVSSGMFAVLVRRSSVDARTIWQASLDDFAGHASWGRVGTACALTDLDQDGRSEFACGVFQSESPGLPGYVSVRSGSDGVLLRTLCTRDALLQVDKRR